MSPDTHPTVAILTLGCKLNQAESQALARELLSCGCGVTQRPFRGGVDAYVVNSCSVTHVADRKSRHLVRLARRLSPDATIVLAGCYADNGGADLAGGIGADLVVRNADKASLAEELLRRLGHENGCRSSLPPGGLHSDGWALDRTRAFVKIQEGCDDVCSFCIVPRTRGRERSVPIERVVTDVLARQAEGVQEVVLTGTQLGNWGRDLGMPGGPAPLLAALLARTTVPRLHLSSLQAQDINEDLLRLWDDTRLCRHFHLPLQSGSDRVLAAMRRRYSTREYLEAASLIRERVPDVAITADVMAGFPGETEADFQETYRRCQEVGFAAVHVFPYSRRPGTAAALVHDQVSPAVKRHRLEQMLALARASADAFRARFEGRTMAVLWEESRRCGARAVWQGLTGNYLRVYTDAENLGADPSRPDLTNRLLPTRLDRVAADGLWGEPVG